MTTLTRRRLLAGMALAPGLAALGLAGPSARAQDGGHTVHELDWDDAARQRPVPALLYLPRPSGVLSPLVVFSHGLGGSRRGYSYLGRHFADAGVACLHLQHVGSDRRVWAGGNPLELLLRLRDAAQEAEAIARVQDVSFGLDRLLEGAFGAHVDPARIVAAGHSFGANTAMLAAGARLQRLGRAVDFRDERVRAAILLSAPPFHGAPDPQRILAAVRVPTLHVTTTEDTIRVPGYYSGADDRVAVFEAMGSARKALAVFEGGSHSIFTDRRGPGGPLLNARIKEATQALALAFVRSVLDGDDAGLQAWPQRHADLLARYVGPASRA
ncbi:MAG: alpha/beta hydrolase family protein [Rubrivivax sp.]